MDKLELEKEHEYLENVNKIIRQKISSMGQNLYSKEDKQKEFIQYAWDSRHDMDPTEMRSVMAQNSFEVDILMKEAAYFKKLFKIQNNPYFGGIIFEDENKTKENIYIGITYLNDSNEKHLIYDWRSPICSLFYDYEIGPCSYKAPIGMIKGNILRKRQYKIENGKIEHVFDNNISIDDDVLQEVLSNQSSEKMKNIVNTIQQEQNKVIRNISDNILIVQGIAGSGKTSVALHRIAFLLYKIENLSSNNVLIFSPNNIFSEYISNVLPELGEDNTIQTTFRDFLVSNIKEYKNIENFSDFISRYYTNKEIDKNLVKYKQSDEIILDIDNYIKNVTKTACFIDDLSIIGVYYTKEELNSMLKERYKNLNFFDRIDAISIKISEMEFNGSSSKSKTIKSKLLKLLNIKKDYRKLYNNFYLSNYCKYTNTNKSYLDSKFISYEDATLFVYMKCQFEGFPYNNLIKQVVIDEAQDYTRLQFLIISKIFKKSDFTILGDVNQTINPYYKYDSLFNIKDLFNKKVSCLNLEKTYRSSSEIIEYTNKILNLSHVVAIRKPNSKEVLFRTENNNLKKLLINDINYLKKNYDSIAIITKDNEEAQRLYNLLSNEYDVLLVNSGSKEYKKGLIIIPSYIAKGLEFDSVIVYNTVGNKYNENEKYLYYVACTRAQHELIIYNE